LSNASVEQKIVDIHGTRFGGQPGQLPTVVVPCLFNSRMREVHDHRTGSFDKNRVKHYLSRVQKISERTGSPYVLDIMATTPEAIVKYIGFVSEQVNDLPFFFDGIDSETRVAAARHVESSGLQDRAVWNSLTLTTTKEEFGALVEHRVRYAILQAFDRRDPSPKGSLAALTKNGLLDKSNEARLEGVLVDIAVLDVPSMGASSQALALVKKELGIPAGCAPANATYLWKSKRTDLLKKNFGSCHAAACAIMQFSGANYIVMGPIRGSPRIFKTCAMTDAMIAYASKAIGIKPLTRTHPIYKIF
jgi:tetrahydromethanopterin S-methyltransferase subunit H